VSSVRGKTAVVTGAASGIGRALAVELAGRGARLALSDVNEAGLAETAGLAGSLGAEVATWRVDVSDRDQVLAHVDDVVGRFAVVHQVYNNAGIAGVGGSVLEKEWADFDRTLGVDLWGVIHGTKAFLPHLVASGDGHVVNISSLNGIMGQATLSDYCAAKFAVRGFTESLRAEMLSAGLPVQVTVVHPGGVKTGIATAGLEEARRQGRLTPEAEARVRTYNDKLLRMPAAQAARTVVDGVEAGRPRVLVGNDAKVIDLVVRLVPRLYPRIAVLLERSTFGR
jgi:NAD(P)-dependent dehydrogenase (short-subunit alcohol dehydrogenase family)